MIQSLYDNMDTIMETLFDTIYIFLWIWYVNVCFFKYNRRMQELEVEIVGLRRIVYAFMNDKTKLPQNQKKQNMLVTKNAKKTYEIDEKIVKLKKGIMFLKKNMDELTERVEILEDENGDYEDTSSCTGSGDDSASEGDCSN